VDYADADYVAGHRFMYGDLGAYAAESALLIRDHLMRPGFVLPHVRLAPVAPYGKCLGQSGNSAALRHVRERGLSHGIWVYLHRKWFGKELILKLDETLLHEALHNELMHFGEDPHHKSRAWARRCQELSTRLGVSVRIEHPRSRRIGRVTTAVPDGCLSNDQLVRWPADLLRDGLTLRQRLDVFRSGGLHHAP
jgi:hypothetical protein